MTRMMIGVGAALLEYVHAEARAVRNRVRQVARAVLVQREHRRPVPAISSRAIRAVCSGSSTGTCGINTGVSGRAAPPAAAGPERRPGR